ncbi:MAG: hypothetical protein EXR67_06075 [Dehalococcoidia bacterium]|nr:hypothetical protein [Dehalococcoidia bacterium]
MADGITIKQSTEGTRIEAQCEHQNGLLYIVPGEMSWVCPDGTRHAHSLAGFFKELGRLDDPRVAKLMQRWGLYFRERPLEVKAEQGKPATP